MSVYRDPGEPHKEMLEGECENGPQKEMRSGDRQKEIEQANIGRTWSQADGPRWPDSSALRERSHTPLTEEERERDRARRRTHHTKAWYCRQLLAVASGELCLTKKQYQALLAFGRVRGYHRRSPSKR